MPEKYQNKYRIPSARLQGYDYGQNGAYFITICTKGRDHFFGEIISSPGSETQDIASLQLTQMGVIANEYWQGISQHFPFVIVDEYSVMPNHVHGIIIIDKPVDTVPALKSQDIASMLEIRYVNKFGPQSGNISSIIRGYKAGVKSFATRNKIAFGWQARFYDHIIRDDNEMKRIRKYIVENPSNWVKDRNNKEGLCI